MLLFSRRHISNLHKVSAPISPIKTIKLIERLLIYAKIFLETSITMSLGPLVVVTSYTKFDNLAHSPKGIEAKHCVRTFRLDPSSGQLTLVSIYTDEK